MSAGFRSVAQDSGVFLFGFEQAEAVGGDAIHEEDADVESGGVAVKAYFHFVIAVSVQGESLDESPLQVEDLQLGGAAAFRKRVADTGDGGEWVGNIGEQLARLRGRCCFRKGFIAYLAQVGVNDGVSP